MKGFCFVVAAGLTRAACFTTPTVQQGPDAEITFDGLHRVDVTRVLHNVWLDRP